MKKRIILLALCLFSLSIIAQAQGAPDQINRALADLSQRVGTTVTIQNLSLWTWDQETFPDSSLGCPQPDQMYAQVVTEGYIFELTYAGVEYEYHVSLDGNTVVLCSQRDPNDPNAQDEGDYSNPLCPAPADENAPKYMRSYMRVDMAAQVADGIGVLNLRNAPNTRAGLVGTIPEGAVFTVVSGPTCDEAMLWWQVNYDGALGWVSEGLNGEYFMTAFAPQAITARFPIDATNANRMQLLSEIEGNFSNQLEWSPIETRLAVLGGQGSESVLLYDPAELTRPRILTGDNTPLTLDFRRNGEQILTGSLDGSVQIWNVSATAPLTQSLFLNSHQSEVGAVAFSPDGSRFVSAGTNALTNANVDKQFAILVWDVESVQQVGVLAGHTGRVLDLIYTPDGSRLLSVGADNSVRLWDGVNFSLIDVIQFDRIIRSIAVNGNLVAFGGSDGSVTIIDLNTGSAIATYQAFGTTVNTLAFSSDGGLLAAGGNGSIQLWDVRNNGTVANLNIGANQIVDLSFSQDRTLLAGATLDQTVLLLGVSN